MKLYKPVLIESAEQAEALAFGTIARKDVGSRVDVIVKHAPWAWWAAGERHLRIGSEVSVGFEALVPIEAKEETVVDTADLDLDPENEYWSEDPALLDAARDAPKRTRFVTPWGEPE